MSFLLNMLLSAAIISLATWVAENKPQLAGFIVSLPLSTMIILVLTQTQYSDTSKTMELAKSIFTAIPLTLIFFVPFLLSDKLKLSFGVAYGLGVVLLAAAYLVHRSILEYWA